MSDDDRTNSAPMSGGDPSLTIAYLVNQYPLVSHTFIRREIDALERLGVRVERFAIRGWRDDIIDPLHREERARTRYVLRSGRRGLLVALIARSFVSPRRMASAVRFAVRVGRRSDRSLVYYWAYLAEACVVARWVQRSGVQHVHAHFGTNSTDVAALTSLLTGIPFSFTAHGPEEFDRPAALGLAEKIRRAAFVVAISSFGRSQLSRWVDRSEWDKFHVVHCGLDRDFLDDAGTPPPDTCRLISIGRLSEQKGQLILVAAVRMVLDRGIDCEVVLAGDGDMRPAVESLIAELDLKSRIRITGWIASAQVREELLQSRALVLPSFAEGLPVVIMEAMAMRRPVLSTYVAGIPELVVDGESGWLFPAGDVGRLSDAIEACLATPLDRLAEMGDQARRRVIDRHDVDVEAAHLKALFLTASRERRQ